MKNEVIQQKTHRSGYEAQIELVGAKVITVETQEELQNAVNERTAMMFFLKKADPLGKINRAEWVRVGKQRDVPRFNDAASDAQKSEAARKATSQRHGTLLPAATQSHWFIAHCWNPASVNCCSSMINSGAGVVLKLKQVFSCIRFFSAGEMLAAQADYNPAHLDSSARPITRPKRPAVCARA